MRRFLLLGILLAPFALPAAPAHAQAQNFSLFNRTGHQIDEVYVSESANRNWGRDIMGQDVLENGKTVDVTFNAPSRSCRWDLRVKYEDGEEATWTNLNLCNISRVTLFWDRRNQTTRATTE